MRETNLNKPISRTEVKVGDKIRVSREVVVTGVRESSIYDQASRKAKNITVVNTASDTLALTATENVTLLERDKPSEIVIPTTATHVFWQDTDDYDYYARRDSVSEEWVTSEGPDATYTTEALIQEIEDEYGEFDAYKPGSFQVLKHKYAAGGVVGGFTGSPISLSSESIAALSSRLGANILPRNQVINPRIGGQ